MSLAPSIVSEERRPVEETVRGEERVTELLDVLNDADCLAVLAATGEESLSATEIVERCEIPSSTAYRKIDRLVEAGLLRETLRIRASGKHTREYRRCIDEVDLSLSNDGVELRIHRPAEPLE